MPKTVNVRTYSLEDIIGRIMESGAGLTRSDVLSVLEAYREVCAGIVAGGGAVNTPLWRCRPFVRGAFAPGEDASEASVRLSLRPGKALLAAAAALRPSRVRPPRSGALIESVTDTKTGEVNGSISPLRDIKVAGRCLKITGDDPSCGLYFVSLDSGVAVKSAPGDIAMNLPSRLIVLVPSLSPGPYTLRLSTQYNGSLGLKAPRVTVFDKTLFVRECPGGGGMEQGTGGVE